MRDRLLKLGKKCSFFAAVTHFYEFMHSLTIWRILLQVPDILLDSSARILGRSGSWYYRPDCNDIFALNWFTVEATYTGC
eukprot:6528800-Heterocapsa_arctica.AAC.1